MGMNIKKIFMCIAVMAALPVSSALAQHYIGIRGGWGGGSARIEPKPNDKGTVWGLYNGGISWKYYSPERYVGGVEADLLFMQQGFRNYELTDVPQGSNEKAERESYYQRTINSIMLPIYWQTHGYMFMRRLRVFLNLGVTLTYNYSSEEETYNYFTEEKTKGKYDMKLTRDNPFTYGLGGGVGLGWSFGRLELLFEGRYYFGYGDIYRNRNRYELNPLRSPLDNIQFSLGAYWRLGKKGILSPPTPKVAAKMRAAEEARREKDRLKSPLKQVREWDNEYENVIREESSRLDKDIRLNADEITRQLEALTSLWADGIYIDALPDSILPAAAR